ncbi:MAG: iron-containing alcohol dehydrogenase, partial [Spirochaetales bacterium]|nr:iron-containing alcohol dehydrogenase [Spirochaetales bacterium]
DLDVLRRAPKRLLMAGVGDMLAKYVSICEWRISHLINGEYYCDRIASLVRRSVGKCLESAEGLLNGDADAAANVMEGLILAGIAMSLAGVSRPASGMEHYFSHIWDIRALERHGRPDYHGIQVGVGTMLSLRIYAFIGALVPDRRKALESVDRFDYRQWQATLRGFLGSGAEELIRRESVEGKYDKAKHRKRLEVIIERWPEIREIIAEELPDVTEIRNFMLSLGMPVEPAEIGIGREEAALTFRVTKDIRDKYIASRLLWDLGVLEEAAERL